MLTWEARLHAATRAAAPAVRRGTLSLGPAGIRELLLAHKKNKKHGGARKAAARAGAGGGAGGGMATHREVEV